MTKLSVNINKIALLRNSRGNNYPDVDKFAMRCLDLGAHGITLHPRPDQRHAKFQDVRTLHKVCQSKNAELNLEGYPSADFLSLVEEVLPTQCTLVPDKPGQLTSDHGWNLKADSELLEKVIKELKEMGVRTSIFIDYDCSDLQIAKDLGTDRIELYTGPYAAHFGTERYQIIYEQYLHIAQRAVALGIGVNAGHDLNLDNLSYFLKIPEILEVSIGHALIVECIEYGIENVISRYLKVISSDLI